MGESEPVNLEKKIEIPNRYVAIAVGGAGGLSILILRPSIVTISRLVRFVTGLVGVGIFTLVRLVGIVGGRCLIGFIFFIGLVGLIRLSSLLVRLSVNDRWVGTQSQ